MYENWDASTDDRWIKRERGQINICFAVSFLAVGGARTLLSKQPTIIYGVPFGRDDCYNDNYTVCLHKLITIRYGDKASLSTDLWNVEL